MAILRNPFIAPALGTAISSEVTDLAHQRNSPSDDVNTGVMLVKSEPLVRQILRGSNWWEGRLRDLEQVVVQRLLLNDSRFLMASVPYTVLASYCWLKLREGERLSKYAQAMLCRLSMLHANCLSVVKQKAAVMRGANEAYRLRCGRDHGWRGNPMQLPRRSQRRPAAP